MPAGLWLRFQAFAADYLLIFGYLLLVMVVSLFLIPSLQELFQASPGKAQLTGFLLVTLPVSLYFVVTDSRLGGQSLGKRKIHIQVVDENHQAISVSRAVLRTALKFLPWELSHFMAYRMIYLGDGAVQLMDYVMGGLVYALIFLYILMVIFTKNKQSLYDWIAKTHVVKSNFS